MRTFVRPTLCPALLASALSGCTAIADPGSYEYDTGCDLELELVGFDGPHLGADLTVQLDTPPDSSGIRQTKGVMMVVGIPEGNMTFRIPTGVHYRNASIDFFVDNAPPFGSYNPQLVGSNVRGDHSWTIEPACGAHSFTHVAQFDDFEEFTALSDDLVFDMEGFGLSGQSVEFLVTQYDADLDAVDGDGDGRFTLAFQHTTSATETAGHFRSARLRGSLDRGAGFVVEVFVDRNGNQVVEDSSTPGDPADEGYVFRFAGSAAEPGTRIPLVGDIPLDAAAAGTEDHSGTVGLTVTAP